MEKANDEIIKDKIFFMKWFYYYVYFSLPATIVSLLAHIKECGEFESYLIIAYSIFCTIVIIGLHQRRLWSWKLNWGLLILFTVLMPFKYTRIPYWIALALVAYLWFFPNYIYFKKRKHLFSKRIQNTGKRTGIEKNCKNV